MYAQYKTPKDIISLPIGSSLNNIKNKLDSIYINKNNIKLVYQGDDFLKYNYKTDSLMSECIFYFVDDSLIGYSLWIKTNHNIAKKILLFISAKYGKPDTLIKNVGYRWSKVELENKYKNKINILYHNAIDNKSKIRFSKFNIRLLEKAKKENMFEIKL